MLHTAIALLAAAVLLVPLAHRLGAGAIVGYLAAGVVVGPHALSVVPDVEALAGVSELGIAMLLFVIGLGLEPPRVWEMRRSVFGAGVAQVALCGAALFALALAAGLAWEPALLVGLALAQSSTAIAMQLMAERNILASPTGRIAFGVHLFQDLFALPLIALVSVLAHSDTLAGEGKPAWLMAVVLVGAVVGGRLVLRRAFRLIADSGLREVFTAGSLLLVLGMAALLHWAGFSLALGAFIAGILLADSEYRKALETDIEPFKGLLLGLFFLTVGASLDLAAIAARWPMVLGIAAGMVAVKSLILYALAPLAGVPRAGRFAFIGVLAQGSEFGIVVIAAAQAAGLLSGGETSVLAPAIVLSMLFSPFALAMADRLALRRQTAAPAGEPMPPQEAPVIIAGFGRVGQIVARMLFAQGIRATVLDRDPQQIEIVARFGYKVFYGDATRLDLLHAAGAGEARLIVNAIDDVDGSLALTDTVRQAFPRVAMVARARNVRHAFELRKRGVTVLERETFEGSLRLAREALETLGLSAYDARRAADRFRRHNLATMEAMYRVYGDEERMVSAATAGRDEFEANLQRDRALADRATREGWQ
jgi:glutathione-regulated potassium-efflux system ancillary protein KefC